MKRTSVYCASLQQAWASMGKHGQAGASRGKQGQAGASRGKKGQARASRDLWDDGVHHIM